MHALKFLAVVGSISLYPDLTIAHPFAASLLGKRSGFLSRGLGNPAVEWAPDQPVCANSPHTIAGTFFHPRSLPRPPPNISLHPRTLNGNVWCCPSTQTYIIFTAGNILSHSVPSAISTASLTLLGHMYRQIIGEIRAHGNAPLPNGIFEMMGGAPLNLIMHLWSAGDGGLTWQVAANALVAVEDYMNIHTLGGFTFQIFDNGRQVGLGQIN